MASSRDYILGLEGTVYCLHYLLKYIPLDILLFTLKFGLGLLPSSWRACLMCVYSHIFFRWAAWYVFFVYFPSFFKTNQSKSLVLGIGLLQTGYSVVSACAVTLRWKDKNVDEVSTGFISGRSEGIICLILVACCGFAAGALYRFGASFGFLVLSAVIAILAAAALHFRQVYDDPPGFSCPGVPILPAVCIFLNIFLFAQLHYEAWVRFVVLSIVAVGIYALYGQHHANPDSSGTSLIIYQRESADV
nr:cationic amino acid transporter 9, chloroplastic [Ipomoea batatas]